MRPEGWEHRLDEVIREAKSLPFDPKRWNCARFSHRCAEAVCGKSLPYAWRGSLEASVDAALPRVKPSLAQRGDVVMADVPLPTLGVCCGHKAAFVGYAGLTFEPMRKARIAWSV